MTARPSTSLRKSPGVLLAGAAGAEADMELLHDGANESGCGETEQVSRAGVERSNIYLTMIEPRKIHRSILRQSTMLSRRSSYTLEIEQKK